VKAGSPKFAMKKWNALKIKMEDGKDTEIVAVFPVFGQPMTGVLHKSELVIYSLPEMSLKASVTGKFKWIASLANDIIITSGKRYRVWEIDFEEKKLQKLPLPSNLPAPIFLNTNFNITEDGRKIIIPKSNRILLVWEVETELFKEIDTQFGSGNLPKSNIGNYVVLPNNLIVVSNVPGDTESSILRIFSILDSTLQREIKINHSTPGISSPSFISVIDKTNFFLNYNHQTKSINYILDSTTGSLVKELILTESLSGGVAVTPYLLMAPGRGLLYSINLETGALTKNLPLPLDDAPQIFYNGVYLITKSKQLQLFIER